MNTSQNYYVFVLQEHAPVAELLSYFRQQGHPIDHLKISPDKVNRLSITEREKVLSLPEDQESQKPIESILYIKVDHVYVEIHTTKGKRMIKRTTLESAMEEFPDVNFVRTHRSYAVNQEMISHWDSSNIYFDDVKIPISRRRKKEVMSAINSNKK